MTPPLNRFSQKKKRKSVLNVVKESQVSPKKKKKDSNKTKLSSNPRDVNKRFKRVKLQLSQLKAQRQQLLNSMTNAFSESLRLKKDIKKMNARIISQEVQLVRLSAFENVTLKALGTLQLSDLKGLKARVNRLYKMVEFRDERITSLQMEKSNMQLKIDQFVAERQLSQEQLSRNDMTRLTERQKALQLLAIADWKMISFKTLTMLKTHGGVHLNLNLFKQVKAELNKNIVEMLNIKFSQSKKTVFCSIASLFEYLEQNTGFNKTSTVVYIQGDGRGFGRKRGGFMLCMMIEKILYTVAVSSGDESFECLSGELRELLDEMKVSGVKFRLVADWKFLQSSMGILTAKSSHFCIWCDISRDDLKVGNPKRSIMDNRMDEGMPGVVGPNLWSGILSIHDVFFDSLHLMLRVSDRLTTMLIDEITYGLSESAEWEEMKKFAAIVQENLPSFKVFKKKEAIKGRKIGFSSLMGPDTITMLKSLNIAALLDEARAAEVRQLWDLFLKIYKIIKAPDLRDEELNDLEILIDSFFELGFSGVHDMDSGETHVDEDEEFDEDIDDEVDSGQQEIEDDGDTPLDTEMADCEFSIRSQIYSSVNLTPYLHLLRSHVVEMMRKERNLVNLQALEGRNNCHSGTFFRASSRRSISTQMELMLHDWRIFMNEVQGLRCLHCKKLFKYIGALNNHNMKSCSK
jgi:hypothetical protein